MRSYAREVAFCLIYGDFIDNEGTPEDLSEFFDKTESRRRSICKKFVYRGKEG